MSLEKARELLAKNPDWYDVDDDLEDLFGKRAEVGKALWQLFRDGNWTPRSDFIDPLEQAKGAYDGQDLANLFVELGKQPKLRLGRKGWDSDLTRMLKEAGGKECAAVWPDIPDPMHTPMGYHLAVLGCLTADDIGDEPLDAEARRIAGSVSSASDVENLVSVFGEERAAHALAHAGTLDGVDIWSKRWIEVAMKVATLDQQAGILARCDYYDNVLEVAQVVLDSTADREGLADAVEGYGETYADFGRQAQAWVLCMLGRGKPKHVSKLLEKWEGSIKKQAGEAMAMVEGADGAIAKALVQGDRWSGPWSAVTSMPTPRVLEALCERIKSLKRGDNYLAEDMVKTIGQLPAEAADTLLQNPVGKCAQRTVWTHLLKVTGNPITAELLVQQLGDSSKVNVEASFKALKALGAGARPAVSAGAKAKKKAIREACGELLTELADQPNDGGVKGRVEELAKEHEDVKKSDPVAQLLRPAIWEGEAIDQARRDELMAEQGDVFWIKAWRYAGKWADGRKAWLSLRPEGEVAVYLSVQMATGYGDDEATVVALLKDAPVPSVRELFDREKVHTAHHLAKWLATNDPDAPALFAARLGGRTAWQRSRATAGIRALDDRACLLPLLDASKAALREEAATLLVEQPPAGSARALKARLKKEKSDKVRGALVNALVAVEEADVTPMGELPLTAKGHKELDGRLARAGKLLKGDHAGPKLKWSSGKALTKDATRRVMALLAQEGPEDHPLDGLRRHVTGGAELLAWLRKEHEGSKEARLGWVLFATAVLAEDAEMLDYGRPLDDLARGGAFKEAEYKLIVLGRQGSNPGLQWVDHWARKARSQGLKERAGDLLDEKAADLGVSRDALAETLVPDMGFAQDLTQAWPHGDREFTLRLAFHNALEILDDGKVRKGLPNARKGEDADTIKASKKALTALKKQLKQATTAQLERMEDAMVTGRSWARDAWTALYVDNPVLSSLARTALWSDGAVIFRLAEDGSATTVDEEEHDPGDQLHLVHPLDLTDEQRAAWTEVFSDYEIIVPWDFFQRVRFTPTEEEAGAAHVLRLKGRKLGAAKLRWGLERRRWQRGEPQDGGAVCWFTKAYADVTAVLDFSPGFGIGYMEDDEEMTITRVSFAAGAHSGRPWPLEPVSPSEVPPVVFSEVLRDVESL